MIILDTHIWIWWATESEDLSDEHRSAIEAHRDDGLGISAISCWEVAKLVEYDRLGLTMELETWMRAALRLPGVRRMELTPQIAIESTQLPGSFHSDPADQIIVATARLCDVGLVSEDQKIRDYDHVRVI